MVRLYTLSQPYTHDHTHAIINTATAYSSKRDTIVKLNGLFILAHMLCTRHTHHTRSYAMQSSKLTDSTLHTLHYTSAAAAAAAVPFCCCCCCCCCCHSAAAAAAAAILLLLLVLLLWLLLRLLLLPLPAPHSIAPHPPPFPTPIPPPHERVP
jgi:hypothetical protein